MQTDGIGATFGIEEEFMFLDRRRLDPVGLGPAAVEALTPAWGARVKPEFLLAQVEHASEVFDDARRAHGRLLRFRRDAARIAAENGAVLAGVGAPLNRPAHPAVSPGERYARVAVDVRGILSEHQLNGLHVHVGVPDRERGVVVLNSVRSWLPVIAALSANSPFDAGVDTGFGSWRTIVLRRWATQGAPPRFADAADYARRIDALIGVGATTDRALVAWSLRLSDHLPTLEFRAADAQLSASDTGAIVAVCRAVARLADAEGIAGFEPELIDAGLWAAARDGHAAHVPDPLGGGIARADEIAARLVDVGTEAVDAFEAAAVSSLLERGSGADRQRAALRAGGVEGLAALIESEATAAPMG